MSEQVCISNSDDVEVFTWNMFDQDIQSTASLSEYTETKILGWWPYDTQGFVAHEVSTDTVIETQSATPFLELVGLFGSPRLSYRKPDAVERYLSNYPEIMPFISLAYPVLVTVFGYPVEIVLEVMTYPEEGSYDELVAWIQSKDNIEEGLDKLEKFEDEWFREQPLWLDNRLNFNIEFQ